MSTGSYSLQIFWLYNRKVVFKLEVIFFYLVTKQGIQRTRNIAFLGNRELIELYS